MEAQTESPHRKLSEASFNDHVTLHASVSDPELRMAIEDQVEHELALQQGGSGSRIL